MGAETKIAWANHTFNPWRGCTKIVASKTIWAQPKRWNKEARLAGRIDTVFCASLGVNTPEVVGESRAAGLAAKEWTSERLSANVRIKTHLDKNDKYGRLLVEVFLSDGESLNEAIIASGHGVAIKGNNILDSPRIR